MLNMHSPDGRDAGLFERYRLFFVKINVQIKLLLILLFLCGLVSVGCTGSQEIVEPSRDSLNKGKVEYITND